MIYQDKVNELYTASAAEIRGKKIVSYEAKKKMVMLKKGNLQKNGETKQIKWKSD